MIAFQSTVKFGSVGETVKETMSFPHMQWTVSKFGMLVEAERALEPGTVVSVETNTAMLGIACIRHCTPNGVKYRIGMHVPDHRTGLMTCAHAF